MPLTADVGTQRYRSTPNSQSCDDEGSRKSTRKVSEELSEQALPITIYTSEPIILASHRMNFGNGLGIAGNDFDSENHQDKQA